jgi:predicted  nucleic acid-binding Zn-ribbon protein
MADTYAKRLVMKAGTALGAAAFMSALVYAGQGAPAPKNEDVLPALLAEVRGLRAAMEQMASAGPRIQLFVSRLQLQEGRMAAMIRRLDTLRDNLAAARRDSEATQDALKHLETAEASGRSQIPREELTEMLARTRRDVAERKGTVARLSGEETQLAQDLAVEQGRWTDINQRLDDLERSLSKR